MVKNPLAKAGDSRVESSIPGWGRSLEKEMTTHFSILDWRSPWAEETGGLQSTGSKELDTTERLNNHQTKRVQHCLHLPKVSFLLQNDTTI